MAAPIHFVDDDLPAVYRRAGAVVREVQRRLGYCPTSDLVAEEELRLERDEEYAAFLAWIEATAACGLCYEGLAWVTGAACSATLIEPVEANEVFARLGEDGKARLVVTDDQGVVYATDSANPNIYKVDPKTQAFSVFLSSPQFAPVAPGAVGLNGIDVAPDGEHLLAVTTIPAGLYSIPLADPQSFVAVQTSGDAFAMPGDPRFPGPDGIEFHDEDLYVVYDGGVQKLAFSDGDYTQAAVATTTAVPTGLTSITIAEGEVYVIDSEVFRALYLFLPPELPFSILHVDAGLFPNQ